MLLHKGEVLFRQGETGSLYHLKSGMLKIVRVHQNGSELLMNIIVPGETIPHHSLISQNPYHGTAVAIVTSEVEPIPAEEWYGKLERNPEKYREVALLLQQKLRMMQQRMDHLTTISPSDRLSMFQNWFAEYIQEVPVSDVLTQEEIGQWIGIRRETVNRLLKKHSL
ncbi:cAMP regulatory protein [Chlamydia abortus]|uniref:Crp/Fnr family transcriptional regulator n=1 Tax=Paenibacillus residui TaxID=629724 RepID=A0ABW3DF46_9BACL|nr:Crp/Fnr family transcriptional regulator [Paenibacillus sp. 32O-W]SHE11098.1 cAMP regulatory protein [Chlamydia abortus]